MGLSVTKLADRGGTEESKANPLAAAKMKLERGAAASSEGSPMSKGAAKMKYEHGAAASSEGDYGDSVLIDDGVIDCDGKIGLCKSESSQSGSQSRGSVSSQSFSRTGTPTK